MSKPGKNRHGLARESLQSAKGGNVPAVIRHGADLLIEEASKSGTMTITLPDGQYRVVQNFASNGRQIAVASIDRAPASLDNRRTEQFFQFATQLAMEGDHTTDRFDRQAGKLIPITVHTHDHVVDANLVYIPEGAARYMRNGSTNEITSFTTGEPILKPGEPTVSFVSTKRGVRSVESAMAAATEIVQSCCIVDKVTLENGRSSTDTASVKPYQEAIANSTGNMLGAVALGWTYGHYKEYLETVYDTHASLWGGTVKGRFGISSTDLVAPHLMYSEEAYEQVADGGVPDAPIELIARQPVPKTT